MESLHKTKGAKHALLDSQCETSLFVMLIWCDMGVVLSTVSPKSPHDRNNRKFSARGKRGTFLNEEVLYLWI